MSLGSSSMWRVARIVVTSWSAAFVLLIGLGTMSHEAIGAVTWGQTSDIWAMSIAISDLQYGLKGGLGHREVEAALAAHMTTTKSAVNVGDDGTRRLALRSDVTTRAIQAAASLDKRTFLVGKPEDGSYVVLGGEDIGLAHFYKWSFRLFGYDAFSTRKLYVALLTLSFVLFLIVFWSSSSAVGLLALVTAALFATTTTNLFNSLLPSIAANRFLSTLAIIPFFHVVCAVLALRTLTLTTLTVLLVQAWLLMWVISARSSAAWTMAAFPVIVLGLVVFGTRRLEFARFPRLARPFRRQVVVVAIAVYAVSGAFSVARDMSLDSVYFGEGVLGHHLRWHNAYLGLALHPSWPANKPYPGQSNELNDNISWVAFETVAARIGINPVHPAGIYRNRVLDRIIRDEYFEFIRRHPTYMLELFAIYKPEVYYAVARGPILSLTGVVWLVMILTTVAAGALLSDPRGAMYRGRLLWASLTICVFAQVPAAWAYPAAHSFGDQLWSIIFAILLMAAFSFCLVLRSRALQDTTSKTWLSSRAQAVCGGPA